MHNFISVAVFTYPHEYAILRLLMDQQGIKYFFENETMIQVFPFYSNALGGIHLKVHPLDKQKVLKIIEDLNYNSHLNIV